MQSSLVYICKADTPNIIENHPYYIGLTENTFKDQFYKHIDSFKYGSKRNAMELSNFEWENKYANTEKDLVWNILAHIPEAKRCLLCSTCIYVVMLYICYIYNIYIIYIYIYIYDGRDFGQVKYRIYQLMEKHFFSE